MSVALSFGELPEKACKGPKNRDAGERKKGDEGGREEKGSWLAFFSAIGIIGREKKGTAIKRTLLEKDALPLRGKGSPGEVGER